jgi:hypothetical protein
MRSTRCKNEKYKYFGKQKYKLQNQRSTVSAIREGQHIENEKYKYSVERSTHDPL